MVNKTFSPKQKSAPQKPTHESALIHIYPDSQTVIHSVLKETLRMDTEEETQGHLTAFQAHLQSQAEL